MLQELLGAIWRRAPRKLRRWSMRLSHARFTVTAGAIVIDKQGRVLLLKHRFRTGSGWGIPGGFVDAGEQPVDAVRRELQEEVGLDVDELEVLTARTFKKARQIEILFRARPRGDAAPQSVEIRKADWFYLDALPQGLPGDQKLLLRRYVANGDKGVG